MSSLRSKPRRERKQDKDCEAKRLKHWWQTSHLADGFEFCLNCPKTRRVVASAR